MTTVPRSHSAAHDAAQGCSLDDWWLDAGLHALSVLAESGTIFSADQLRTDPVSLPEPAHSSHWGALFAIARSEGIIRPVGYIASATPSRHHGVLRLWRGGNGRAA